MPGSATKPRTLPRGESAGASARARWGLLVAAAVVAIAMAVPSVTGVDVRAGTAAPLLGDWAWRVGWSSLLVVAIVAVTAWPGLPDLLDRLSWRRLLALSWAGSVLWMVVLALVDGPQGLGRILDHGTEYLASARSIDDAGAMLREYVARIPLDAPGHWPVHLAGHPPGAVLMFIGLDRVGLGSWQAAGLVVVLVAATLPAAVATTLDRLGERGAARQVLPFLVVGPAAVLMAVSADAVFATTGAWAAAALAAATAARRRTTRAAWALVAGLLFGWCVMESYGLLLLGALAVAVLLAGTGSIRARGSVALASATGAVVVVAGFAALGFAWWEAYPALRERYWDGIAGQRPSWYWVLGNLAALILVAGPMVPAALAAGFPHLRAVARRERPEPVSALVAAGVAMVAAADLSLMSKAEVERIWLPFLPCLVVGVVWLPERWRRWGLLAQGVAALVLQHVIRTVW
jgi:methylthioxylose transferase